MRRSAVRVLDTNSKGFSHPLRPLVRNLATVKDPSHKDPVELDQVTSLPNGLRIATESLPGPFSGVGVYIDAGSRFENDSLRGVSHIIDRLAFKSTTSRSADQMLEALETLGGNIQCASTREALMYQSATFNSAVPTTLGLLAETIRNPLITEEEVQQQLETADYEIGEIWNKPDLILPELVHMAAYKGNTLGNPLLCPKERLPDISKGLVEKYRDIFYKPERMVVAFAGVEHKEAVRLTERFFGDMTKGEGPKLSRADEEIILPTGTASPSLSETTEDSSTSYTSSSSTYSSPSSTPPSAPSRLLSKMPFFKNLSTSASNRATVSPLDPSMLQPPTLNLTASSLYTGGFLACPLIPAPPNAMMPHVSHIHLAFEALPISSPDIYALACLQTLLGGGGSFSAGGPGKGMYSRLYTNVLNQHHWVESCVAFNHSYTDSGLFGIAASCMPGKVPQMLDIMCHELQALTLDQGFSALEIREVNRAKNQLRSSLLMNLESRMVELEDLGRQVQVHGHKIGVKEMCKKIEELTVQDLRRVAKHVFGGLVENPGRGSGAPTVVVQEAEKQGVKQVKWENLQERISRWSLGKR